MVDYYVESLTRRHDIHCSPNGKPRIPTVDGCFDLVTGLVSSVQQQKIIGN